MISRNGFFFCLDPQFCAGDGDNFPAIPDGNADDYVSLPSAEVRFVEWIFPTSLVFQCNGSIGGWLFRAKPDVDLNETDRLPQWSIYRELLVTTNNLDFEVIARTGGGEDDRLVETDRSGVYRYTLNSPVNVKRGDVVGVSYDNSGDRRLQLSFMDVSVDERMTPLSYRRNFNARVFVAEANSFITAEDRFMPFVTPIMAGESKCLQCLAAYLGPSWLIKAKCKQQPRLATGLLHSLKACGCCLSAWASKIVCKNFMYSRLQ
jgi:hypothetical protein